MKRILFVVVPLLLIVAGWVAFSQIANSRTSQTFGRIVPRVDTSQKFVALTLDDGPTSSGTAAIRERCKYTRRTCVDLA